MANHAFTVSKPMPTISNGHTFERYNFHRLTPHTKIYEGYTGLTFRQCNLVNCDVPADSVLENCNNVQIEFCSNLHPDWTDYGLTTCSQNCSHVTGTDVIQVNGVTVSTVYHYADEVAI